MGDRRSRHAEWLLRELPVWQRENLLDAASAERLRQRYGGDAGSGGWTAVLFPVLGALLVGLGIILLVAHNWDRLDRGLRLLLSFTPLALGQLACVLALQRDAVAPWREAAAVFTALAFAAALALVGQIYHFPGDLDRYLLSCALLALPLAWLLDSALLLLLCAAALAGWAHAWPGAPTLLLAAAPFALLLPQLGRLLRRAPDDWPASVVLGLLLPLFYAATVAALDSARIALWWLAALGAALALGPPARSAALWQRTLRGYGAMATALAALIGSFPGAWRRAQGLDWNTEALLVAGALVMAGLILRALRGAAPLAALQAVPALLIGGAIAAGTRTPADALALVFSLYVLLLGVALLREGLLQQDGTAATRGLVLLAVLVLLRFLGTEWSFTVRGIAFVTTGAAFLLAALWLRRRVRR